MDRESAKLAKQEYWVYALINLCGGAPEKLSNTELKKIADDIFQHAPPKLTNTFLKNAENNLRLALIAITRLKRIEQQRQTSRHRKSAG